MKIIGLQIIANTYGTVLWIYRITRLHITSIIIFTIPNKTYLHGKEV